MCTKNGRLKDRHAYRSWPASCAALTRRGFLVCAASLGITAAAGPFGAALAGAPEGTGSCSSSDWRGTSRRASSRLQAGKDERLFSGGGRKPELRVNGRRVGSVDLQLSRRATYKHAAPDTGVAMGKPRDQRVLELLWENRGPTGAYGLMEVLKLRHGQSVGPPTVYRALQFLMDQGIVSKIESRNAYVPCAHPERRHICLFFICASCGASVELEDQRLERLISETATLLEFRAARRVVEVEGTCEHCLVKDEAYSTTNVGARC